MNTEFLIVALITFIIGIIISWFLTKSNTKSKITELQTKLNSSEQNVLRTEQEIRDVNKKMEASQNELRKIQQEGAGLAKEVQLLNDSIKDYRLEIQNKENELTERHKTLTGLVEAKVTAETALLAEQKTVEELQIMANDLNVELAKIRDEFSLVKEENATFEANYKATLQRLKEQQEFIEGAQNNLKDAFGTLSATALRNNNTSFVELAKAKLEEKVTEAKGEFEKKEQAIGELVKPLSESLRNMDTKIQDLEGKRIMAYSDIWNYLD